MDALLSRVAAICDARVESINGKYAIGSELGQGRFSVVHVASCRATGRQFAAKVVENGTFADEDNVEAFEAEVQILRRLAHPHVVALEEVVMAADATYILIALCSGGELFTHIADEGPLAEAEAKRLFAQVALATEYLHAQGVAHRDIKPENIVYTDATRAAVQLIDFGYAGDCADGATLRGLCGTPDYVAPEVLSWYEEGAEGEPYDESSDMWSLGVLLFVMLSGAAPFAAESEDELLELVCAAKFQFEPKAVWAGNVSEGARDVVARLLVVARERRLTIGELLAHPWLSAAAATARAALEQPPGARGPTAAASGGGGGGGGVAGGGGFVSTSASPAESHGAAERRSPAALDQLEAAAARLAISETRFESGARRQDSALCAQTGADSRAMAAEAVEERLREICERYDMPLAAHAELAELVGNLAEQVETLRRAARAGAAPSGGQRPAVAPSAAAALGVAAVDAESESESIEC